MEGSAKTAGPYVTSVLNTCSQRVGAALPDFRGQCSGLPVACFRPVFPVLHLLRSVTQRSIFFFCWFGFSTSVFEAQRRNPKPLAICFMCSRLNHQLSLSTQLVDPFTSAAAIWNTIILLCDTLYVSNCSLVYLRG